MGYRVVFNLNSSYPVAVSSGESNVPRKLDLAPIALSRLEAKLVNNGSSLSYSAGCAIASLLEALEKGLTGQLQPVYHLASIDPGLGKTLAVAEFLKVWWERGCPGGQGVLIGVSRLSEILTYIEETGVPRELFGVLTSSPELNAAGVRTTRLDEAPILFTTQQMIASRVRGKLFSDATEFHFRGQPRALRVWDESLIPAEPLVVGRDELGGLLKLRLTQSAYVEAVDALMGAIDNAADGDLVGVPASLVLSAKGKGRADLVAGEANELMANLAQMAGRSALVVDDGGMGKALVAAGDGLPKDFAPVVILDASGRVRTTYELWTKQRGDLVRLPPAVSDYRNLEVNYWLRSSGKDAMKEASLRNDVLQALADAINEAAEASWLVVHYKWDEQFGADLRERVVLRPERVRCIHWGNHHGTNEFRDIPNVALVGQPTYRRSDYLARGLAVGLPFDAVAEAERDIRRGERAHHYLQAACRGALRNVVGGIAGKCRLLVIASPSAHLVTLLRNVFPGCHVREWWMKPVLKGKVKVAAENLVERFSDPEVMRVRKSEIREAAGIERPSTFASYVMQNRAFRDVMHAHCIDERGQHFERAQSGFDILEDGYVYEPSEKLTDH
jgi:hypothetical protein